MSMLGKMLGFGRNEEYDRAIRLFDQGLYEEAIHLFENATHDEKQDPLTHRLAMFYTAEANANLGQNALKRGAWEKAEIYFRNALEIHPHYADLHFDLALCLRYMQRHTEALHALNHALEINPRYAKALLYTGLTLYTLEERENALKAIMQALSYEPGYDTVTLRQALRKHHEEDYAACLQLLDKVSFTNVDDIQFHFRLGDDLYRRGMLKEAIEEYTKALELNPHYADIHNHLGMAYNAQGTHSSAIQEFLRAVEINPGFVDAWVNLGVTYKEMGDMEASKAAFKEALALEPDNIIIKQNMPSKSADQAA